MTYTQNPDKDHRFTFSSLTYMVNMDHIIYSLLSCSFYVNADALDIHIFIQILLYLNYVMSLLRFALHSTKFVTLEWRSYVHVFKLAPNNYKIKLQVQYELWSIFCDSVKFLKCCQYSLDCNLLSPTWLKFIFSPWTSICNIL